MKNKTKCRKILLRLIFEMAETENFYLRDWFTTLFTSSAKLWCPTNQKTKAPKQTEHTSLERRSRKKNKLCYAGSRAQPSFIKRSLQVVQGCFELRMTSRIRQQKFPPKQLQEIIGKTNWCGLFRHLLLKTELLRVVTLAWSKMNRSLM